MNKIIYSHIYHKRFEPIENVFSYKGFQVLLNIDDLGSLKGLKTNKWGLFSIYTRDHAYRKNEKEAISTIYRRWVKEKLSKSQIKVEGDIYLQTIPRIMGYSFNPISFWYCYDGPILDQKLRAVICEVNNTFGEGHNYILDLEKTTQQSLPKEFHVSPFFPRTGVYEFNMDKTISIKYLINGTLDFIATLTPYCEVELNKKNLIISLFKLPFFTFLVVFLIHWQAAKLFFKKVKFFTKPVPLEKEDTHVFSINKK